MSHTPCVTDRNESAVSNRKDIEMIYTTDDVMRKLDSIESNMQANKSDSELMTIRDVIRYSKYSDSTIRRNIRRNTLKPFKKDGKKLFRRIDVDRWLNG